MVDSIYWGLICKLQYLAFLSGYHMPVAKAKATCLTCMQSLCSACSCSLTRSSFPLIESHLWVSWSHYQYVGSSWNFRDSWDVSDYGRCTYLFNKLFHTFNVIWWHHRGLSVVCRYNQNLCHWPNSYHISLIPFIPHPYVYHIPLFSFLKIL